MRSELDSKIRMTQEGGWVGGRAGDVSDRPQEALILIPRADSRLSSGVLSPSPSLTQITRVVSAFCATPCR